MEYHLEEAIRDLSHGTWLYKFRNSKNVFKRRFYICMKGKFLSYDGSKKVSCTSRPFRVDFVDIEDIRRGWKTDLFNNLEAKVRANESRRLSLHRGPKLHENLCFSIILTDYSSINLIAENEVVLQHWIQFLSYIVASNKNLEKEREKDKWLKDKFKKADLDRNGNLCFQECLNLLRLLNISMSKRQAKCLFDEANNISDETDGDNTVLNVDEFLFFYHRLIKRKDVENLFKKFSGTTLGVMGPEDLMHFLNEEQKAKVTLEDCKKVISTYESDGDAVEGYLSLKGFQEYLSSAEFDIMNKEHLELYQDMTHPMSHYFIASSHNTYLLSDQLVGASSVEGYIKALNMGCRCIELDCWDGPDKEPVIYHGHTLTSKILFRDALDAIKMYAFKASNYPVILSIENHCSYEFQKVMANHLTRIFKDELYTSPVTDDMSSLPSPESLQNKIIIKAKRIINQDEEEESVESDASSDSSDDEVNSDGSKDMEKVPTVANELSDLVNLCQSIKFKSFKHSETKNKFFHISSFAESKANSLIGKKPEKFIQHNRTFLSRIYPSGLRTDSSNYDPIPMWNAGCQVVALNYQTESKSMRLNNAKFTQNGGCGYILKPEYMRTGYLDRHDEDLKKMEKVMHIKIISGQHIPKPGQATDGEIIDPYVKLIIRGKHMEDKEEYKTRYIKNNGFNPVWNEEFEMKVEYPETSLLEVVLKDNSATGTNEFLGGYVLPFSSIEEGYRNISLYNRDGNKIPMASIFVYIKIFNHCDL